VISLSATQNGPASDVMCRTVFCFQLVQSYNDFMIGETATSVIQRILQVDESQLSQTAAKVVLALHFSDEDRVRIQELADKSTLGTLTPSESDEYEGYVVAADILALWQSKARLSMKQQPAAA